jgi:hypothetical protein
MANSATPFLLGVISWIKMSQIGFVFCGPLRDLILASKG